MQSRNAKKKTGTKGMLSGNGRRNRSLSQPKNKSGFPVLESIWIKRHSFSCLELKGVAGLSKTIIPIRGLTRQKTGSGFRVESAAQEPKHSVASEIRISYRDINNYGQNLGTFEVRSRCLVPAFGGLGRV